MRTIKHVDTALKSRIKDDQERGKRQDCCHVIYHRISGWISYHRDQTTLLSFNTSAFNRGYVVIGICPSVSPSVCPFVLDEQHNYITYWWNLFKFSAIVHICLSKSWLNFRDVIVTVTDFKIILKCILIWSAAQRPKICLCTMIESCLNHSI